MLSINVHKCSKTLMVVSRHVSIQTLSHKKEDESKNGVQSWNYSQVRFLRNWRRAHMYPPNFHKNAHHFFYAPIAQQLREREATLNPVQIHDIGITEKEFLDRIGIKEDIPEPSARSSRRSTSLKSDPTTKLQVSNSSDLIKLVDVSIQKATFDYGRYKMAEGLTESGKAGLKELAHHYHIYRDLFSEPPTTARLDTELLPLAKIPDIVPQTDVPHVEVLQKWFPGSLRRNPVPARSVYHFTPHVPIYAEFCVPEEFIQANEESDANAKGSDAKPGDAGVLVTTPVYSGNLIEPLYASVKPSIVLDVRGTASERAPASYFDSVEVGKIKLLGRQSDKLYTLMLLNLDTIYGDADPVCHWMVANIGARGSENGSEAFSWLPIYGIRGLGYHRYVFLLYQHDAMIKCNPIQTLTFSERQIKPQKFMKTLDASAIPVGLSWFQSQWDSYSQKIFHETLNMRAPVYEYIEPEETKIKQTKYPPLAPFNIYLDHFRHPKELAEEALVERLKSIDPFDYESNFSVDPIPNAYGQLRDDKTIPSWAHSKIWKKRNKLGQWRHLRPVSAKMPLSNNADLDRPIWPYPGRLELPNKYPRQRRSPKPLRETKWVIPAPQHPTYRIEHEDIHAIQKELEKED